MEIRKSLILMAVAVSAMSCETVLPIAPPPAEIHEEPDGIFIVDITGKQWEITSAVEKYGLEADRFNYGLGPDAIPPINFPKMLDPDQPAYPSTRLFFRVIGANIKGDARAYRIENLNDHEVVNEVIGGEDVFVGW